MKTLSILTKQADLICFKLKECNKLVTINKQKKAIKCPKYNLKKLSKQRSYCVYVSIHRDINTTARTQISADLINIIEKWKLKLLQIPESVPSPVQYVKDDYYC